MDPTKIIIYLQNQRRNRLLMNSLYLMLATAATAAFGFVFWVVVARSYSPAVVGTATTLLSLSGLISLLSLAGFDSTLVRFLPQHKQRHSDHINTALVIVALVSLLLAVVFAVGLKLSHSSLAFVASNPYYLASFVIFTSFTALNTLTNTVFLAYRQTWYVLVINVAYSSLRVLLPLLVHRGGPMMIFGLTGLTQLVGFGMSLLVMRWRFDYHWNIRVHADVLRLVRRYSAAVYVASVLNLLPPTILPLLVMQVLGAAQAAYYYMAFTIATMLFTTTYSLMQSAFAEAAHDQLNIRQYLQKASLLSVLFLLPLVCLLVVFSPWILRIFGIDYAAHGTSLLRVFSLSAFGVAGYTALGVVGRLTKQLRALLVMNVVYAAAILGLSYAGVQHFGLHGVGWGWLVGNGLATLCGLSLFGQWFKVLPRRLGVQR